MDETSFGVMQAEVRQLKDDVRDLKKDMKTLLEMANKSKGAMWSFGSLAALIGSTVTWIASHWPFK